MTADLAQLLAGAWQSGSLLSEVPRDCLPRSRQQAYAVQDRMAELLGAKPAGWKVGATGQAVQQAEGYDGPLPGRIFAERTVASGTAVPARLCPRCKLELEIAFRAKDDLAPGFALDPAKTDEHFEVLLAFDLTSTRFAGAALPDNGMARMYAGIADNGNGGYVVAGPELGPACNLALRDLALSIIVDGAECAQTDPAKRADPLYGLGWVLAMCAKRGVPVRKSELILTGAANIPLPLAAGASIEASVNDRHSIAVAYV